MTKKEPQFEITDLEGRGYGLQPTPDDARDFELNDVFGAPASLDVPNEDFMVVAPLGIKDQRASDMCTAFSLAAISEDQEGIALDPNFTFAMIKKMQGDWRGWGGDLRSGCKVATKIGFIESGQNPFDYYKEGRNFVANWNNWPATMAPLAQIHRKESYFKVTGAFDVFDCLRQALWSNRGDKSSIYTGCIWRPGWTGSIGGIISKEVRTGGVGHAFKVFGQKMINDEPYLMVQNSFGADVGDAGVFYFPREAVNRNFNFGAYMFKDMPKEEAKDILRGKGLLVELPQEKPFDLWDWIRGVFNKTKFSYA